MTPKEKAEELLDKFSMPINGHKNIYYKQCALIAVDEILKSNPIMPLSYMLESEALDAGIDYWQEVKKEIKNL